jgi:hypothetical protein
MGIKAYNTIQHCTSWKRITSHLWRVHCKYFNLSFVSCCAFVKAFARTWWTINKNYRTWEKLSKLTKHECHPCFFKNSFGYVLSTNLCRKENSMKIKMVWQKQEIQAKFNGKVINWLDTTSPRRQVNRYVSRI